MGIFKTFSRRQNELENAGKPDVYQYEELPRPFRVQVIHIWVGAIGPPYVPDYMLPTPPQNRIWTKMHDQLARELGVFRLSTQHDNPFEACQHFLLNADTPSALDLIELTFRWIDRVIRKYDNDKAEYARITQSADDAIEELNGRFREHGIGYQYIAGELIRIDSQFVHANVVTPAIALLTDARFAGPAEEYLRAHEHYRHGRLKEAISEALKAFESTMKAICTARKWAYPENATASRLIEVVLSNGLVAPELTSHFTSLQSLMQAGLPTVRNRNSGHGQGQTPVTVPNHLAAYSLHLSAANIVFLVEAHNAL